MSSSPLSSRQSWDDRIEIAGAGSATYRFDPGLPKPCVHPLITPAGHRLTGFEMSDHVWHRGLWFTIKFVNGTNFWEEQPPFGIQISQAQPVCEFIASGAVRVTHLLEWKSEATGVAIRERRTMTFREEPSGASLIDWTSELARDAGSGFGSHAVHHLGRIWRIGVSQCANCTMPASFYPTEKRQRALRGSRTSGSSCNAMLTVGPHSASPLR